MLLEEPNVEGEPKPFQMARNVYKSCMGKERIEQLGSEPLKKTIMVSRDEFGKETNEMRSELGEITKKIDLDQRSRSVEMILKIKIKDHVLLDLAD